MQILVAPVNYLVSRSGRRPSQDPSPLSPPEYHEQASGTEPEGTHTVFVKERKRSECMEEVAGRDEGHQEDEDGAEQAGIREGVRPVGCKRRIRRCGGKDRADLP